MTEKQNITVFITGGHLTPALAVIEEIRRRMLPWTIVFIGRKYALEADHTSSIEHQTISKMGISFLPLVAGRLTRALGPWSLLSLSKIPLGFLQSLWYVATRRPRFIISFGGYVALPTALAGALLGIPVVTHEQTITSGLSNWIISRFAKRNFISFPKKTISPNTIVTGLPLRNTLFYPPTHPSFTISDGLPILYITGGSTGALSLNKLVFAAIPSLVKTWTIIHQTGSLSLIEAMEVRNKLPPNTWSRYVIAPYFEERDVAWIYRHARLVVGRAGANTIWEAAVLGKVVLLIPLPWAGSNEQRKNAQWLVAQGSGEMLEQPGLTGNGVIATISRMMMKFNHYDGAAHKLTKKMPRDGAKHIVDELLLFDSN